MLLQEIFDQLTYSEFSQLHLGGEGNGGIRDGNINKIVSVINTGLTALHTRFNLKEGKFNLELQPNMYAYLIESAYAKSTRISRVPVRYIDDTEIPFKNNLLKVERVLTERGLELNLNDKDDEFSILTPSVNTIRVPTVIVDKQVDVSSEYLTNYLTVYYRANHPLITEDAGMDDPESYEVDLPYSFLQALCYYVASRLHNPSGMVNQFHAGNSYAALYENECMRLEQYNLQIDRGVNNTRLEKNGWV